MRPIVVREKSGLFHDHRDATPTERGFAASC
jgi:hypothetical protein